MIPEDTVLNEIGQSQKDKYYTISLKREVCTPAKLIETENRMLVPRGEEKQ